MCQALYYTEETRPPRIQRDASPRWGTAGGHWSKNPTNKCQLTTDCETEARNAVLFSPLSVDNEELTWLDRYKDQLRCKRGMESIS